MRKRIYVLIIVIMMFVTASGCSLKSGESSSEKVKVLFSVSDNADKFRNLLSESAKTYAESQGVELTVMDAANSIEKQVEHMKEAVSGGYDAIICAIVNPETALQIKKAAGGLPIVFINSQPKDVSLLEKNKYIFVASDEMVAGRYQAEYVIEHLKNKKDIKVVLFKGEKEHSATKGRTKAVKETFREKGINAEYVFEDYANWSRQTTKEIFNVFLSTGKSYDCVIANNDEMALGVIDSLKENNIDPSLVPILGVDATKDGQNAIIDGSMKLTIYQSGKAQGKSAVDAAIKLGSGSTLSNLEYLTDDGKYIMVPFEKVDKSNVNKYME